MGRKRFERTRRGATSIVVAALVAAVGYALTTTVTPSKPAFSLTAGKGFTITSAIYATYTSGSCSGYQAARLYPGVTRCLAVTVHNPLSVALDVRSLAMTVTSFTATPANTKPGTPACTTTMLPPPTLFTNPFTVGAAGTTTIAEPIQLTNTATNQDRCANGTFHFSFTGSATYTDTTTTDLVGTRSGTSVTLTATVTPGDPTSDAFGPHSAPDHHVSFYSCKAATCTTKTPATPLATVTLVTSEKSTKSATATTTVTDLSVGTHYFDAVYTGTLTATPDFSGSHSGALAEAVSTTLPAVCQGHTYSNVIKNPLLPLVVGTNGNDLIELGNDDFIVLGLNGTDCITAGTGSDLITDGTGNDGISAENGANLITLGNGDDKVSLGNGTDRAVAGNGNDTVTVGNGHLDTVKLGNGTDTVTEGSGTSDQTLVGNGNDTVAAGNGNGDHATVGNGVDTVTLGTGSNDTVTAGNGKDDMVRVGKGNDTVAIGTGSGDSLVAGTGNDTVVVGNGSTGTVTLGNGTDNLTLGNGSKNKVTVGNGNDTVTVGIGSTDKVTLGNGADKITITPKGSHDTITAGTGTETTFLGSGTHNSFAGTTKKKDTCYVPKPPSSYHGSTPAGYYDDTVTNCTVETT